MPYEIVALTHCRLGEGPLWHPIEQRLYWVDITRGRLYSFDPASGNCGLIIEERPITGMTLQADGGLLLFRDQGRIDVLRDGQIVGTILDEIPDERETRFNDVIADPEGRVFCGTMSTEARPGRLYRINLDGSYDLIYERIGCANGMGFTRDLKHMYFTDSTDHVIWICGYDRADGSLGARREFARTEPPVMPDGLTVDAEGNVWSAQWNGARVVCYSPDGRRRHEIELPTSRITSVAFGGPGLEELYVTSASEDDNAVAHNAAAGSLFRIKGCGKGCPEFVSRIGLKNILRS
jgi:D-xylonolactonase